MAADLDRIVNDPIFLPYYGWVDDHSLEGAMPAIQQWRYEFLEFVGVLAQLQIDGKCLQIGLGTPGASHSVWSSLFNEAWSLEADSIIVDAYMSRVPDAQNVIVGSSFDPAMKRQLSENGPFDLLFIDADHSYPAVRSDFFAWGELVRNGGMIALHDSLQGKGETNPTMQVWLLLEKLVEEGYKFTTIGTDLGISYIVKE